MFSRGLLAAFGLLALATPALAQVEARAGYLVTLGGINIATVDVGLNAAGSSYEIDLSASVTGLGNIVTSGTASARSSGAITAAGLASTGFALETVAGGERFTVAITYGGGEVSSFQVDPPLLDTADRVPLERRHLTGVNDMLAAFIVRAPGLEPSICQRSLSIFTGLERFDIAMQFVAPDNATSARTGYQGPLVLCALDYRPISGHFSSSEITSYLADVSRILIWYAPLGDTGFYIPYRALVGTGAGDLSMILIGTTL